MSAHDVRNLATCVLCERLDEFRLTDAGRKLRIALIAKDAAP